MTISTPEKISSHSLVVYCYFLLHTRICISWYFYVLCVYYALQQTITAGKLSIGRLAVCVSYELESVWKRDPQRWAGRLLARSVLHARCILRNWGSESGHRKTAKSTFEFQNKTLNARFCFIAFCNFNDSLVVKMEIDSLQWRAQLERINVALFLNI